MAAAKQLVLSLAVASDVPADISADPTRIRQVLFNLLGNAVKFTDQGTIELRLRSVTDGARLRIEVVDTGRGVPADQQHRLFQEFERLSTATTGPIEGAGLGLVLSARVAALMGGQIGYDGNSGGGSIFWLELPVVANAAATSVEAEDVPPAPASPRPRHVLVVDDIAMNRDVARSFLCVAGHRVVCVEGGRESVAAAAADDFDIVLMDVRMPEMDGLEATWRVRALEGPRGRVPIVALTAQAFSGQVEECRAAGMDGHLGKPLTLAVLLDTAERVAAAGQLAKDRVFGAFMPAATPGIRALALEQPVINSALFEATAAVLSPEAVASYLRTLVEQGETLLHALHGPDALMLTGEALAEAAHALAGSAGMFGFERLAATGRHFERAVQTRAAEAPVFATSLGAALQTALEEMRRREALVAV
jgi:CheY-like chemotaxis protein